MTYSDCKLERIALQRKMKRKRKDATWKCVDASASQKHALGAVQKSRRLLGWARSRINNHRIETSYKEEGDLSITQNRINTIAAAWILSSIVRW